LRTTTLGTKRAGDVVNIEVDLLAKYIHKLLQAHSSLNESKGDDSVIELIKGF
jgi:riboflavin synthase alpha subunit